MTKVVINTCFGGFGLSETACENYLNRTGKSWRKELDPQFPITMGTVFYLIKPEGEDEYWSYYNLERDDPILVAVVEELGEAANGRYADLTIVEIPDDVEWQVEEYDGNEHVAEKHRTWR